MAIQVEPVGWHEVCGERAYLTLDEGRRSVTCGCPEPLVPEAFFAAGAYGRADATSSLERIAAAEAVGRDELAAELREVTGR